MIAILDYGTGNIASVLKAFSKLGYAASITRDPSEVLRSDALVFPGVGAFGAAMYEIERCGLLGTIRQFIESGRPVLGICLGMQILFGTSEESPGSMGLGVMDGQVERLRFPESCGLKVPHMGWNTLTSINGTALFAGIPEGSHFYFAHSYHPMCRDSRCVVARTWYGDPSGSSGLLLASAVAQANVHGVQFHPEKSGECGLTLLRNFAALGG